MTLTRAFLFAAALASASACAQPASAANISFNHSNVPGWDVSNVNATTLFFVCRVAACGVGSSVTVRSQNVAPASLDSRQDTLRASIKGRGPEVLDVILGKVTTVKDRGYETSFQDYEIRYKEGTATADAPFVKYGYIANRAAKMTISIVSEALNRDAASRNFATFAKETLAPINEPGKAR